MFKNELDNSNVPLNNPIKANAKFVKYKHNDF